MMSRSFDFLKENGDITYQISSKTGMLELGCCSMSIMPTTQSREVGFER